MEEEVLQKLLNAAWQARENSYSPYSDFAVGASLLTEEGVVYTGTNIENSSYGLTMCAERVALYNAKSAGAKKITAMAVAACSDNLPFPCGACLQVMSELAEKDIPVILTSDGKVSSIHSLKELFPHPFRK